MTEPRDEATSPPDALPPSEPDAIREAREYGIDIGLMNSLLDLPVIERLRRNDADVRLDRQLRLSLETLVPIPGAPPMMHESNDMDVLLLALDQVDEQVRKPPQ
jgi:hypothetical protein